MQKKVIIGLAAFALASGLAQAQTKLKFAHAIEPCVASNRKSRLERPALTEAP